MERKIRAFGSNDFECVLFQSSDFKYFWRFVCCLDVEVLGPFLSQREAELFMIHQLKSLGWPDDLACRAALGFLNEGV